MCFAVTVVACVCNKTCYLLKTFVFLRESQIPEEELLYSPGSNSWITSQYSNLSPSCLITNFCSFFKKWYWNSGKEKTAGQILGEDVANTYNPAQDVSVTLFLSLLKIITQVLRCTNTTELGNNQTVYSKAVQLFRFTKRFEAGRLQI